MLVAIATSVASALRAGPSVAHVYRPFTGHRRHPLITLGSASDQQQLTKQLDEAKHLLDRLKDRAGKDPSAASLGGAAFGTVVVGLSQTAAALQPSVSEANEQPAESTATTESEQQGPANFLATPALAVASLITPIFVDAAKSFLSDASEASTDTAATPTAAAPRDAAVNSASQPVATKDKASSSSTVQGGLRSSGPRRTLLAAVCTALALAIASVIVQATMPAFYASLATRASVAKLKIGVVLTPVGPAGAAVGSGLSAAAAATAKGVGVASAATAKGVGVAAAATAKGAGVAAGAAAGAAAKGLTIAATGINAGSAAVSAVLPGATATQSRVSLVRTGLDLPGSPVLGRVRLDMFLSMAMTALLRDCA